VASERVASGRTGLSVGVVYGTTSTEPQLQHPSRLVFGTRYRLGTVRSSWHARHGMPPRRYRFMGPSAWLSPSWQLYRRYSAGRKVHIRRRGRYRHSSLKRTFAERPSHARYNGAAARFRRAGVGTRTRRTIRGSAGRGMADLHLLAAQLGLTVHRPGARFHNRVGSTATMDLRGPGSIGWAESM
jgi:hypothetical protein